MCIRDRFIGHPLGTQRDRFKDLPAAIEVIEGLVLKISDHPCQEEVIPCESGSQAVSYTHLDVYKRQE